jgi:hypothetical protein
VQDGKTTSGHFLDDFLGTIQTVVSKGSISFPAFVEYITDAFAFIPDEDFASITQSMRKAKALSDAPEPPPRRGRPLTVACRRWRI